MKLKLYVKLSDLLKFNDSGYDLNASIIPCANHHLVLYMDNDSYEIRENPEDKFGVIIIKGMNIEE